MIANHAQPCPAHDQNLPGSPPYYFLFGEGLGGGGGGGLRLTTECGKIVAPIHPLMGRSLVHNCVNGTSK